jgi:phospholipid-binding lipoprotein MlaA
MFNFNDKFYFWVLKPVSKVYGKIVPEKGRIAINRFFKNLGFPVRFVNNALQGKFKRAGIETLRFVVNSTIGVIGLADPADSQFNLQAHEEDFGQTLGHYGVGDGFPIVLPFLGPTNLRDLIGMVPDLFLNPVSYVGPRGKPVTTETRVLIKTGETVNKTSLNIGVYESLKEDALDPYTFMRDAYKQNRDPKIAE